MKHLSLKAMVLLTMGVLVVSSCLLTAFMAARLFTPSLEESLANHARSLAQSLSGPVTEMVLINDMVGVQRLLDSQFDRDSDRGYALLEVQGRIRAHSFEGAVPAALQPVPAGVGNDAEVTAPPAPAERNVVRLGTGLFLEVALPLMDGHAGVLRMGFSKKEIERRIARLWLETAGLTAVILVFVLSVGVLWMRRLGRPLTALVQGIELVGDGNLNARVSVVGQGEVATLARAFNSMSERLEGSMLSLEAQTAALRRSHRQLRLCNEIVTDFAALDGLEVMARHLLHYLRDMVATPHCLLFLEHDRNSVMLAYGHACRVLDGREEWEAIQSLLEGQEGAFGVTGLKEPLVSAEVGGSPCQTVLCIMHDHAHCGALVVGHGSGKLDETDLAVLTLVLQQVSGSIGRALRYEKEARVGRLRETADVFCGMMGRSAVMHDIFRRIRDVAPSGATVLISGESGTGKELVARAIHSLSEQREKPFVVINCAAYPESLLESELFGYEKGAFTGAMRQKPGRFEQADGGTVFLDEIGEISPLAQVRLLRVLQTRQFERVGGEQTLTVNVRVLAATNRDLAAEVRAGRFREDLYYRLDVISIVTPPLRERSGDLPMLAHHFLTHLATAAGRVPCTVSPAAMRLMMDYDWPGNVRELENMLEQCATLCRHGAITPADLPERIRDGGKTGNGAVSLSPLRRMPLTLEDREASAIREALELCGWSRKLAAARLGIGRTTLYTKMKRYGIQVPDAGRLNVQNR